jgi:hypothetical protein
VRADPKDTTCAGKAGAVITRPARASMQATAMKIRTDVKGLFFTMRPRENLKALARPQFTIQQ